MGFYGFLAVGGDAAFGAWLRWWLGVLLNPVFPTIPLSTLAANLIGGYLVGMAVTFFSGHAGLSSEARLFVVTGFMGGLTTLFYFFRRGRGAVFPRRISLGTVHIAVHPGGSLAMTVLGILTVNLLKAKGAA